MRLVLLPFLFLFSLTSLTAQQLPEWYRVHTFDDSIIEMNTSLVTFTSRDITRVRFRWTFDQPESLGGSPQLKYKSRLEVMEFNCSLKRYRPYHLTFFDSAGNIVRLEDSPPGEWRATSGPMIAKLFAPACDLIKQKTRTPVVSSDAIKLENAARYALSFSQHLEEAKDFKPIIKKFFVANYLNGYLNEADTKWFLNLNRETAAKVKHSELERFYVALLNTGYLSSLYFISQLPSDSEDLVSEANLIPTDIVELIGNHSYSTAYKGKSLHYDYLAENIDSVERLQIYTDLLERIGALMRKHVVRVAAEHSNEYQGMSRHLYRPEVRICNQNCLGLPKGTRLFEVNVPVFRLQLAEINGHLRIVSAIGSFP